MVYMPYYETPTLIGTVMNPDNSTNQELTEEEMNENSAQLGLVAAAVATGLAVSYAMVKALEWNDKRKAKKEAKTED